MKIQVALVRVDDRYWLDRQIGRLRGGQKYSHGAFIVHQGDTEPMWWDVHWRWFSSSLRAFPAKNYGWKFEVFDIEGITDLQTQKLHLWMLRQEGQWISYDILGAIQIFFGWNPPESPRSFQCFEFVTRGLLAGGLPVDFHPERALASDLLESGLLVPIGANSE
ncbi:MAG: hypothetical protein Q8P59_01975 [Dehalococcoidia bacterium]|nr:hypothetical protein [Dehalococcoidia bacterium]